MLDVGALSPARTAREPGSWEVGSRELGAGLCSPSGGRQGEERKSVRWWEKRAAGNSASDKDTWEQQGKNRSANPE